MTTLSAGLEFPAIRPTENYSVMVACDLDQTLIYSANSMALRCSDNAAPALVVAEVYEGAPISFMTRTAWNVLERLVHGAIFVPVTTRTVQQFRRVNIPGRNRGYAVTTNGAVLLHDGVPDAGWTYLIQGAVADNCAPLEEVYDHLLGPTKPAAVLRGRVAENTFVYCIVERNELSVGYLEELSAWCHERGWKTSMQGRKLYCVPSPVSKEAALAEIRRRHPVDVLVAAGDSKLDAGILQLADAAIRPAHGELDEAAFHLANLCVTSTSGIVAGEEILRVAAAYIRSQVMT
ncbi:HAD family hydrolase [Arthrobacter sp. ISL-85]|uniref:HAD family hydrolase n=1 Tax=Arthrobacter sp. ISL-85 TaxID=2819115 RepID=UPI001BE9CB70|nr:HAD family hydrolase [Arthrobacter sp. ISL-85]MBT2568666.1 HAD family hydrolase [Arthrobacter sp. ISL-85]